LPQNVKSPHIGQSRSNAGLAIMNEPTGFFGFRLRGKDEGIVYEFEYLMVDRESVTFVRGSEQPIPLVFRFDEIDAAEIRLLNPCNKRKSIDDLERSI